VRVPGCAPNVWKFMTRHAAVLAGLKCAGRGATKIFQIKKKDGLLGGREIGIWKRRKSTGEPTLPQPRLLRCVIDCSLYGRRPSSTRFRYRREGAWPKDFENERFGKHFWRPRRFLWLRGRYLSPWQAHSLLPPPFSRVYKVRNEENVKVTYLS
jgi:hypothetical protein